MMDFRFWGVAVKPGETVKCDPGESYHHITQIALEAGKAKENVEVFVNADDRRIMLGTLSVDNHPHIATDLVFNKEFELLHSSKTSNISFTGYKFETMKRSNSSTEEGDKSDEEVPLAIPLDFNVDDDKSKEATHGANKLTATSPAAVPSSKPKAAVEETNSPGKPKADDNDSQGGVSGDDKDMTDPQDSSDDDDSESSDEDADYPPKTPPGKKTKIATPSMGNKTGSDISKKRGHVHVATPHPAKRAKKTSVNNDGSKQSTGHVHVATPHPAKQAQKTPANSDKSKQSTGYVCNSCNRTFNSSMGLEAHSKVKHSAAK